MHGVKRRSRLQGEADAAAEREQARTQVELLRRALFERQTDKDVAWKTSKAAVETNPDEYSLWSFRRVYLLSAGDEFEELWDAELTLTMRALKRHPKAYPAWEHRMWLLGEGSARVDDTLRAQRLKEEEKLSALMLARDARNFHSWTHRLRVRELTGKNSSVPAMEKELAFVSEKINSDFANYSAWHVRSKLLPVVRTPTPDLLMEELEFVRQAFYTEPDVQSAWFYHRWLLAGMPGPHGGVEVSDNVWVGELTACQELLDLEPGARWVLHAKAHILMHLLRNEEAIEVYKELKEIVRILHYFASEPFLEESSAVILTFYVVLFLF